MHWWLEDEEPEKALICASIDALRLSKVQLPHTHPTWHDLVHTMLGAKSLLSLMVGISYSIKLSIWFQIKFV